MTDRPSLRSAVDVPDELNAKLKTKLVTDKAVALIRKIHGCTIGAKEFTGGWMPERVDALLFCSDSSYLIETKVSRSDFLADAKKPFRKDPSQGIGDYRYYACPEGLIKPDELPEKWGLIYAPLGRTSAFMPVGYGGSIVVGQQKGPHGWNENVYRHYGSTFPDIDPEKHWDHHRRAKTDFRFDSRSIELERRYIYALCTRYKSQKFTENLL